MRILLIEDDKNLCEVLSFQLKEAGFSVDVCTDGEEALYYISQNACDLILLDRMLPHIDGLTLLKRMRNEGNQTPVIILTALGETNDKIRGLDTGADDYLVKPFELEELLARIRSISRRPRQWQPSAVLDYGDIHYIPDSNNLAGPNGACTLSKREGALMEFLIRNANQILPKHIILSRIWGPDGEVEEGNVDNYIYFIRRRLKSVSHLVTVKTIRGVGYWLCENEPQ
ncbi:MAG: response regulator transcription factor [Roseburia sp.]|nr:response regulator transcription factor [Roseburia sp.]